MTGAKAPDALARLSEARKNIQPFQLDSGTHPLPLGAQEIDSILAGGLSYGALHEIAPEASLHFGAACGFTLGLAAMAAKSGRETLWIQTDFARLEAGALYGIGLDLFGLPMRRLLVLRTARAIDALFAMEEALKCRAIAAVIAELPDDTADLTATRRLSLAARHNNGLGLLLRHRSSSRPSAAVTRWSVAAVSGAHDGFGGIGQTAFLLSLVKNRRGPCGRWSLAWDHHERVFVSAAHSVGVAAPAVDGSHRAAIA